MWIDFADSIEVQIKPDGALAPVKGLANKLPEHAARLAAAAALIADIEAADLWPEYIWLALFSRRPNSLLEWRQLRLIARAFRRESIQCADPFLTS
jgi:hypothetical protein